MNTPLEIKTESDTYDFYWALEGIGPAVIDDIEIKFKWCGISVRDYFQLATRGYYDVQDEKGRKIMQKALSGQLEEILARAETTVYCAYEERYEDGIPIYEPPRKTHEIQSFTQVYHPAMQITQQVVEEAVRKYVETFYGITNIKVTIERPYPREKLQEEYAEYLRVNEEMRKARENGTLKVTCTPEFLYQLYGEETFEQMGEIDHGYVQDGALFVKLKDGTTRYIRTLEE